MVAINADPEVMEFFPALPDEAETLAFIERMQKHFEKKGFCYFAVDKLMNHEFIGFIGLCEKTFEADFTPCVDIGWRLARREWGRGYATEGARRCLEHAFGQLGLAKVVAIAPVPNMRSEQVMKKAGMKKTGTFKHPLLAGDKRLETCVLYEMVRGAVFSTDDPAATLRRHR